MPQDLGQAAKWYRAAAEQGHAGAQNALGDFSDRGIGGIAKDRRQAIEWYSKASAQGRKDAQESLKRLGVRAEAEK